MVERRVRPLVLFHLLLTLFVMTFISFLPTTSPHQNQKKKKKKKDKEQEETTSTSSWDQFKNLLTCKNNNASSQVHDPSSSKYVNIRVVDHASNSSDCRSKVPQRRRKAKVVTESTPLARSSHGRSGGGMQLRKLSGCYECRAIDAEPASRRYPRPRTLCPCSDCGEVFTKPESLEHHQALRHAVSELGPDDSGRNIVEMIFKSSWQKKDTASVCKIERILKVHNTQRTAARFEDYRESVKSRALLRLRKNPRCAADGNELLRFHCTSLSCPLGASSSTSLCLTASSSSSSSNTNPRCDVCTIIRYGFSRAPWTGSRGIRTTASSGRAHDCGPPRDEGSDVDVDVGGTRRAMLVCRVIAGRVRRKGGEDQEGPGQFDSVAEEGEGESYGNLEELFVANPRAILPCFVVIYRIMD